MKSIFKIQERIDELRKLKKSLENKDYSKMNLEETKEKELKRIKIIISTLNWVLES